MFGEFARSIFKNTSVFPKNKEKSLLKNLLSLSEKSDEVQLYEANNLHALTWPDTPEATYIRSYFEPFMKNGIRHYCANVYGKLYMMKAKNSVFPVLVPEINPSNSYICSPFAHYITYGKEVNSAINKKMTLKIASLVIHCFEKLWSFGNINNVIYIDHFLFSTDLHSKNMNEEALAIITKFLVKQFPTHTLIIRSINDTSSSELMKALKVTNWNLLASRYIFFTDPRNEDLYKTRIIKSDMRALRSDGLEISENAHVSDVHILLNLYNSLYIRQHSKLNPQITIDMLKNLIENNLMYFKIVKIHGKIKGVAGYVIENNVMHCPFFGFDKTDNEQALIYRALNTSLLLEAKKRNALFHQSAGGSFYKTIRRAMGALEYMAIYTKHLSYKQRASWAVVRGLINTFGPKTMKKY